MKLNYKLIHDFYDVDTHEWITEKDFEDLAPTIAFITDNFPTMLKERYDDYLSETSENPVIAGIAYPVELAFKRVDPTAYRSAYNAWLESETYAFMNASESDIPSDSEDEVSLTFLGFNIEVTVSTAELEVRDE